jgi:DNA-binding PadR family transcriptional regulator
MSKPSQIRLTSASLKVLTLFMNQPKAELSGADILAGSKILSGSLYPILVRLESVGWLESRWENIDPKEAGRPRRRYYRLTALGQRSASEALADIGVPEGRLEWNA